MVTFSAAPPAIDFDVVRLSNGVRLHYAHQGPGQGPAVLMLHGFTDSWFSFSRVLPLLPADLRVLVPDQRGHGDSDRPDVTAAGYAMDTFADDAIRFMDAVGGARFTLVGHSMGSFIARRVSALAPERVHRVVLVGAAERADSEAVVEVQRAVARLTDPVDRSFVREFQLGTVKRPVPDDFLDAVVEISRRMPARIWQDVAAHLVSDPAPPFPPQCPTLVLGGREDEVFPATEQVVLARKIPGAALELVDGVGHALHWEDPERFVRALERFGV